MWRALWIGLAVGACAEDAWREGASPAALAADQVAVPGALFASPALPGQVLTLSADGIAPGRTVWLTRGTTPGAGPCPPILGGACFDMADATLVATLVAAADGTVSWSMRLPLNVPVGASAGFQAAVQTGPSTAVLSPTLVVTVQHPDDVCDATGGGLWPAGNAAAECELMRLINEVRAQGVTCPGGVGYKPPVHPFAMNDALQVAGRVHATWMADNQTFTHASPGGPLGETFGERITNAGYGPYRRASETIGRGQASPAGVLADWLASPPHCDDIMARVARDIGIGRAEAGGRTYWAAVEAEPR